MKESENLSANPKGKEREVVAVTELISYESISSFKNDVVPFLEYHEAENSLILGLLLNVKKEITPRLMAAIKEEGKPVLVLFQTIPRHIVLSKPGDIKAEKAAQLMLDTLDEIPGLVGEKEFTSQLAEQIEKANGRNSKVNMQQRIYQLRELEKLPRDSGRLVKVDRRDLDLVIQFVYQFGQETGETMNMAESEEKAREFLRMETLYGWEVGGRLISVANIARPTRTNATVNFVYTPPDERKKGYATDCVAALTRLLLNKGYLSTTLYTDLDNPTSNKIYMEIGYKPIMDSIVILFD
ncbi:GNAT family N-acetyltransferase [Metabacillus sp. RGM 3146]|uniref:GNAT family N-acetyltransferase n=1 Tax=Metabacillus sp. RGM 3146 TaxID=3401092 RepID=UPI003B9C73B4